MSEKISDMIQDFLHRSPKLVGCLESIMHAYDAITACHRSAGLLLVCGNGGSAADAEHIVGEMMNKFLLKRPAAQNLSKDLESLGFEDVAHVAQHLQQAVRAISLVSQTALTTAIINDIGPDMVFAQQVYGYGRKGDVLLALSTSGNSPNILNAVKVAKGIGMTSIGMTGDSGGAMNSCCDIIIRVPESVTFRVQELHLPVYHLLCAMVEEDVFGSSQQNQ